MSSAARGDEDNERVVPLLLSNKPPIIGGGDKDDLTDDVELRPEQVI